HIDQAAAIAAERAVGRIRRPFHRPPTRGTLDDGYHPERRLGLRAAGKKKRHVGVHMDGPGCGAWPLLKANGAAVPAAADLRKQVLVWGHGHSHQLERILTIELTLEQ